MFGIGDPVPWVTGPCAGTPAFRLASCAGRYLMLGLLGSLRDKKIERALSMVLSERQRFNDEHLAFFGVLTDPAARDHPLCADSIPGIRFFWDTDQDISKAFGCVEDDGERHAATHRPPCQGVAPSQLGQPVYTPRWIVVDPALRVIANFPVQEESGEIERLLTFVDSLPRPDLHAGVPLTAPVLVVPRVFEPGFCKELIDYYRAHGGDPSGFMQERKGITVGAMDLQFKRRADCVITDPAVKSKSQQKIIRRLLPEIRRAFQFKVTRMERYIVACYNVDGEGGYFRPHRDNTTRGTAHRRFAVTINLNAEEYEGGDLRFPEYGLRCYRAPTGGAVVFSCSLMHEALPVLRGERYCFLPFLYDEDGARIREQNNRFLDHAVGAYNSTQSANA